MPIYKWVSSQFIAFHQILKGDYVWPKRDQELYSSLIFRLYVYLLIRMNDIKKKGDKEDLNVFN